MRYSISMNKQGGIYMKKTFIILLVLLLILTLMPASTFASPELSDRQIYNLTQEGIYLNTETLTVRKALPGEVQLSNDELVADFIIITETLPGNIISKRATGSVTATDNLGGTVYATAGINYTDITHENVTYRQPVSFTNKVDSVNDGAVMTSVVANYSDYGAYIIKTGSQVTTGIDTNANDQTKSYTSSFTSLHTYSTNHSRAYNIEVDFNIIRQDMQVNYKRGSSNYSFTVTVNAI